MNKLICALLVSLTSMMNADLFLDAIKQHDLKKVASMLQHKKYDGPSYVLYITAARESVEQCRNKQLLQSISPAGDPLFNAAGVAALLASFHCLYNSFDKYMDFELIGKPMDDFKDNIITYVGWNFLAGVMFGVAMVVRDGEIETAYNEAIKILELVLEMPYG